MWQKLFSVLTGAPVEQVAEFLKQRQQKKHELKLAKLEGRIELQRAKVEAEKAKAAHVASWELEHIRNSGWKDEFVLLTVSYPVYASFIPWLQEGVEEGFRILNTTPYWYMCVVITIYLAIYGVRWKYASEISLQRQ